MSGSFSRRHIPAIETLPILPIAGVTPFTTIDFPGHLAAVFYTQGCSWRCHYCFNYELQPFTRDEEWVSSVRIKEFLNTHQGLLDGIVFSGGEATIHETLKEWMQCVKEMGYAVGLHTAGIHPDRLEKVLPHCDWVGLDVKAPFEDYEKITKIMKSGEKARESTEMILKSGVDYEFRTTVHPQLLSEDDIFRLASEIALMGAKKYSVQIFKSLPQIDLTSCSTWCLSVALQNRLKELFPVFNVRL